MDENIEAERAAHLESKFNSEIVQVKWNSYFYPQVNYNINNLCTSRAKQMSHADLCLSLPFLCGIHSPIENILFAEACYSLSHDIKMSSCLYLFYPIIVVSVITLAPGEQCEGNAFRPVCLSF